MAKELSKKSKKKSDASRIRKNEAKRLKRAKESTRPNGKQKLLVQKSSLLPKNADVSSLSGGKASDVSNKESGSNSPQEAGESENEDMDDTTYQLPPNVQNQVEEISMSGTEKSVSNSKASAQKFVRDNEESLVAFFKQQIKTTDVSARMQKEYANILHAGLKSFDMDQLKRVRKVFTDEQVVARYKKYLMDRS